MAGLQLFSPTQAKIAADARDEEDLRRATAIKDITRELLDQKAKAERDFDTTMESQRARWEKEESEQRATMLALQHTVTELEERRKRALIPIVQRETELHTKEEEYSLRLNELEEDEEALEEERRLLMHKLDEVSERESVVAKREAALKAQEKGVEAQRKQTALGAKNLLGQIAEFTHFRLSKENDFAEREAVIEGKMLVLDERQKSQDKREKEQDERDLRLKDRYETLQRTEKLIHERNSSNSGS